MKLNCTPETGVGSVLITKKGCNEGESTDLLAKICKVLDCGTRGIKEVVQTSSEECRKEGV